MKKTDHVVLRHIINALQASNSTNARTLNNPWLSSPRYWILLSNFREELNPGIEVYRPQNTGRQVIQLNTSPSPGSHAPDSQGTYHRWLILINCS